jgi:hypothetical protein
LVCGRPDCFGVFVRYRFGSCSRIFRERWRPVFYCGFSIRLRKMMPHGTNGPAVDIITTQVVTFIRDLDRA